MFKKALLLISFTFATQAHAEVRIGVVVSATGAAASLGVPERNTVSLLPKKMSGQTIKYIILDDASDTTAAVTSTRKLIQESKVDLILGSTTTPNSLAMIDVVAENKVPMISFGAASSIISPVDKRRKWVFKTAQNDAIMATAVMNHMVNNKIKTVGYIGFNDAYGEGWLTQFKKQVKQKGLKLVGTERFSRTDTSVTGQALKLFAAKPDAILIGAAGVPAVLPQKALKDRGYKGHIYQTHGVGNADFLRVGGKDITGAILPIGPVLVANQLPDSHPLKEAGMAFTQKYGRKYGKEKVSTFGAHVWDAGILIQNALPKALKKAKPGTPAFRKALRDALENTKNVAGAHGVFNMSKSNHLGLDQRSAVMVKVENGKWKLIDQKEK